MSNGLRDIKQAAIKAAGIVPKYYTADEYAALVAGSDDSAGGSVYVPSENTNENKTVIGETWDWMVHTVTGATGDEWKQIREVKNSAKAAMDKLDQYYRLIRYGATEELAMSMTGITEADLGSANSTELDAQNAAAVQAATPEQKAAALAAWNKVQAEDRAAGLTTAGTAGKGCALTSLIIIGASLAAIGTSLILIL